MKTFFYLFTASLDSFAPVFCKMSGFFCLFPLGSGGDLYLRRILLALSTSLLFYNPTHVAWTVVDLTICFFSGLIVSIPFIGVVSASEAMGDLLDSIRGMSFATFIDPASDAPLALSSVFSKWLAIALLFHSGGVLFLLNTLESFELNHNAFLSMSLKLLVILSKCMSVFLVIAVLFVFIEIVCGICSRVLKFSLYAETFAFKTILSYIFILTIFHTLPPQWIFKVLALLASK